MSTLTALVSYTGSDGLNSISGLVMDAAGNLFGTTQVGVMNGDIYVFEISNTPSGYASSMTTLAAAPFQFGDSSNSPGLVMDAAGNLFGTVAFGGANNLGEVFEIAKVGNGYAKTPTTLVTFNSTNGSAPLGALIMDSAGDLFGTTSSGGSSSLATSGLGTIFEIIKTANGYASTPTTLVNFTGFKGVNGLSFPQAGLLMDAAGDLFCATFQGATIIEVAKTSIGYASTPTVIAKFSGTSGLANGSSLIVDAAGNLFGTSAGGGVNGAGSVFEISNGSGGYVTSPTTLVSFNGLNGGTPVGGLILDAAGNLFGTTEAGGAHGDGTIFELIKTATGYASTPTVLASFSGTNGAYPLATLVANGAGSLFGTTIGTVGYTGSVFELSNAGFQVINAAIAVADFQEGILSSAVLVDDSAQNVVSNLSGLETLAAAGKLASIALTDNGTPTLTLSTSQLTGDAKAIGAIVASYNVAISDSAANVVANLNTLQTLAVTGMLNSVTLTDSGTPALSVSSTQLVQDAGAIHDIISPYTLFVPGVSTGIANFIIQQDSSGRGINGIATDYPGTAPIGGNSVVGFQSTNFTSGSGAVVLPGPATEYSVQVNASTGQTVITDTSIGNATSGQSVTVTGESYVVFNNASSTAVNGALIYPKMLFVETPGNAQVAEIYNAALGRQPDLSGLEYWQNTFSSGTLNMNGIAAQFVASPEFATVFPAAAAPADHGGPNDTAFVTALYKTVLQEPTPDTAGLNYWVGILASGQETRAQMLASFAISPANLQIVGVSNGGWLDVIT